MFQRECRVSFVLFLLVSASVQANPYPDPQKVPKDREPSRKRYLVQSLSGHKRQADSEVLRVQVDWAKAGEKYSIGELIREFSGTPSLVARSKKLDPLGSYKAVLIDSATRNTLAHDSIGTGQLYRKLVRSLTFRFPMPAGKVIFELQAEHPVTGQMSQVMREELDPSQASNLPAHPVTPDVRVLRSAGASQYVKVAIYAEGYRAGDESDFWAAAQKTVDVLSNRQFPGYKNMEIIGVFAPSREAIGSAKNLGMPIPERDSFLGLYFPYWENFGRWYHVVYPTRESRYRAALGQVSYDYPIVLVNSRDYWGVGNYRELTAIPARSSSFSYLLLHEFGHFFGLNEEYEGGGRTELEFAPGITEPWSQNITFLNSKSHADLKWSSFVKSSTPLPTRRNHWGSGRGTYGAYSGGYADSRPPRRSHKPGYGCVMESGPEFCPICRHAIEGVVQHDLGMSTARRRAL